LLTLPVGGGLLYVQPVYIESTGETSYPLLQKILVAFGDQIAFEDTLEEALDALFGGNSGAGGSTEPTEPGTSSSSSGTVDPASPELSSALALAKKAIEDKQAALAAGDWTTYGEADARLAKAVAQALALLAD
jgi:uncharacterized membrane protein (UPF0182 family)